MAVIVGVVALVICQHDRLADLGTALGHANWSWIALAILAQGVSIAALARQQVGGGHVRAIYSTLTFVAITAVRAILTGNNDAIIAGAVSIVTVVIPISTLLAVVHLAGVRRRVESVTKLGGHTGPAPGPLSLRTSHRG